MVRKGMGKGTGKGYKNIVGVDSRIHSQSAKGIKQPQRINPIITKNNRLYDRDWEVLPIRSDTNNPKEARVQAYKYGNKFIYERTFPEDNLIEVWFEDRDKSTISDRKDFKSNWDGSREAINYRKELQAKHKKFVYPTDNEAEYERTKKLAEEEDIMFADTKKYFYQGDNTAIGWTAKELFNKSKKEKEILLSNKPKVDLGKEVEDYGTLTDFGYDRSKKRYFVEVSKVVFPPTKGFTGNKTIRNYYDRFSNTEILRLKRKLNN